MPTQFLSYRTHCHDVSTGESWNGFLDRWLLYYQKLRRKPLFENSSLLSFDFHIVYWGVRFVVTFHRLSNHDKYFVDALSFFEDDEFHRKLCRVKWGGIMNFGIPVFEDVHYWFYIGESTSVEKNTFELSLYSLVLGLNILSEKLTSDFWLVLAGE